MKYAVKKLGMMLLTMLIVSFLAFLAFQVIPGDPTNTILGTDATPEQVEALRAQLGLDRPFFVRYFDWLSVLSAATSAPLTATACPWPTCSRVNWASRCCWQR